MTILNRYTLLAALSNTMENTVLEYRGRDLDFRWDGARGVATVDVEGSPDAPLVIKDSTRARLQVVRDIDLLIEILDEYDNSDASRARAQRISDDDFSGWPNE